MRSVASELVKTIGGIAQSAFPQVRDIGGGATDAALRGSLHGFASGVTAVTEEDASGKSPIEKRPQWDTVMSFIQPIKQTYALVRFGYSFSSLGAWSRIPCRRRTNTSFARGRARRTYPAINYGTKSSLAASGKRRLYLLDGERCGVRVALVSSAIPVAASKNWKLLTPVKFVRCV